MMNSLGVHRGKLNSNFSVLNSEKIEAAAVLTLTRTTPYSPTGDYNPATKLYVDQLLTNWYAVINPQNISADVFARANHTGQIDPVDIAWNSNHKSVTDAEKAEWSAKEDVITPKRTAFNKDFGTTAGTTAAGDHSHTKNDIGLDKVDNTADHDKSISTATQAALDLKSDKNAPFPEEITIGTGTVNAELILHSGGGVHLEKIHFQTGDAEIAALPASLGQHLRISSDHGIRLKPRNF